MRKKTQSKSVPGFRHVPFIQPSAARISYPNPEASEKIGADGVQIRGLKRRRTRKNIGKDFARQGHGMMTVTLVSKEQRNEIR